MENKILEINDLHVCFDTYAGKVQAVRGINLDLKCGEVLAVVGESGCGKSATANSILKLIPNHIGKIEKGNIVFDGKVISDMSEKEMQKIRGSSISMIFQDPMTAINPTMKIISQVMEPIMKHQNLSRKDAYAKALKMIELVGIPDPERRAKQYPFEFSGGMRQRVMIAMALACNPRLLIADEPTTALDVTIQAQIIDLMKELKIKFNTSIMLITHDLGVVANMSDRVAVMYAGKIVEVAEVLELFEKPEHPYTWGLLRSIPDIDCKSKQVLNSIEGSPPNLINPPKGCPFSKRCKYSMPICRERFPQETKVSDTHNVYCWLKHQFAPKITPDFSRKGEKI